MYYIMRKMKLWGREEFDTDTKARHGYKTIEEVSKKVVALETLNDNENVSYVVVQDAK